MVRIIVGLRYYGGTTGLSNKLFAVTTTNEDIADLYTFPYSW